MRTTELLLDELNRVFGGNAWHGPALRNLLDGVSEKQAVARPLPNAHSILELVVHVGTWMDVVARRLAGNVHFLRSSFRHKNLKGKKCAKRHLSNPDRMNSLKNARPGWLHENKWERSAGDAALA